MARFFVDKEKIGENIIVIDGPDAHHIARSLRMAEGDEAVVCDGEGVEYLTRLIRIRDEKCQCEIIERLDSKTEPPVIITLCMAYPKGDKLEVVIQKAVELGVARIIPFESSRCIKRPKAEKAEKQTARLTRIAEEAAKQCGRARIPQVAQPMSFSNMLSEAVKSELILFCYENEDGLTVKDMMSGKDKPNSIAIIVGSEGGFSPEEVAEAKSKGCKSVSLGNRILRCETAPAFVLSAISYEYEL
jgi:16S rRNA (uracil1498-N3)-methyltransferase